MNGTNRKFYISDLHLGHNNCLRFDERPFGTTDEQNRVIVRNWNYTVNKNDEVYVLGDFFWDKKLIPEILPKLNGKIYLIKGNHDRITDELSSRCEWIKDYDVIKDGEHKAVLCHFPIAHWINADRGYIHLYGHIHKGRDYLPFEEYKKQMKARDIPYECYNVGCMLHNYTPVTLEQLIRSAAESEAASDGY